MGNIYKIRHDDAYLDIPYEKEMEFRKSNTVVCECSNRIPIKDDEECVICYWCGKKVYRKDKNKFIHELRKRLEK